MSESQDAFKSALASNQEWRTKTAESDPSFFSTSSQGQSPKILWIGCADSRVPETTVLGLKPGDVFVHRNIANIVSPTDISSLAVIEHGVQNLKVDHVVICGHTGCGGVDAALGNSKLGVLDVWLQPTRHVRFENSESLAKLEGEERSTALSKLNVLNSVRNLRINPTVVDAVRERGLQVHGAIYDLATGKVELIDVEEDKERSEQRKVTFELK